MRWKKSSGKSGIKMCIAAGFLAVFCCVLAGRHGFREKADPVPEMVNEPAEEAVLPVSAEEEELLSALYAAMEQGSLRAAARILNENETEFRAMVQETLGGKQYCYYEETGADGRNIHRLEEAVPEGKMHGLVLTRFNTAFCGDFRNGKPEGKCTAVQAMVLKEPRYTYAAGTWAEGRMNGEGVTGYCYYENVPESGFVMTEKAGIYLDNLLDGEFTYTTESAKGERLSWNIEAEKGVTVLSERWAHSEDRKEYMLPSNEDASRAYVLKEDQTGSVLWNNLILWDDKN